MASGSTVHVSLGSNTHRLAGPPGAIGAPCTPFRPAMAAGCQLSSPTTITFEVGSPENLDTFRGRPGVTLEPPYTVRSVGDDWLAAWNQIWHW